MLVLFNFLCLRIVCRKCDWYVYLRMCVVHLMVFHSSGSMFSAQFACCCCVFIREYFISRSRETQKIWNSFFGSNGTEEWQQTGRHTCGKSTLA